MIPLNEAILERRYLLNETSGAFACSAGSGKSGTLTGTVTHNAVASPAYPGSNNAPTFGGSASDYIPFPTFELAGDAFTIEALLKCAASPGSDEAIYVLDTAGKMVWLGFQSEQIKVAYDDGVTQVSLRDNEATTTYARYGTNWLHVVATVWGAASDDMAIYLNGTAPATTGGAVGISQTHTNLIVGENFNGAIASVHLYEGRVGAAEALALYRRALYGPGQVDLTRTARGLT